MKIHIFNPENDMALANGTPGYTPPANIRTYRQANWRLPEKWASPEDIIWAKDLLMPFVKGDKGRSDKNSHGLGLAIAAAAAERNGFGLNVDCRDREFTAVIEF